VSIPSLVLIQENTDGSIVNTTILTNTLTTNATFAAQAREQYDNNKSGPLTSPTADFLLFLPLQTYSNATQSILSQAVAAGSSASLPPNTPAEVARGYEAQFASLNKKLEANDSAILEIIWADGVVVLGLQHPYSRGNVKASSSSMFDAPVADVGFLRNEVDLALLREGVHFARRFVRTPAIASLNPFEVVPGGNVTASADIDAFIRSSASTLYHPAGSCKMGSREDGGVVDQELKVYGVNGLRVVDASVMPILPASHTMTTVYATAENAADIIKKAGKDKRKP
jgi:choline dehydrogenase-like flavoprotein